MTAKELLIPRYESINTYPNTPFAVGDILTFDGIIYGCNEPQKFERYPDKYPHLSRKLKWWEYQQKSEMPKKLICKAITGDSKIIEIEEWDMEILVGWTNKENRECCSLSSFNYGYGYFPVD